MTTWTCFLDLDGTLADFVGHAFAAHGQRFEDFYVQGQCGPKNLAKALGLSSTAFWDRLGGAEFWESIPVLPDARAIVDLLEERFGAQVYIATSPSLDPSCMVGKHRWIERHFPQFRRRFFFGPGKEALAHPGAVLVDDFEETCTAFRERGGHAFTVPRPWNHRAAQEPGLIDDLRAFLERIGAP
jgi:5'(3')-deoxyribonucleotidase